MRWVAKFTMKNKSIIFSILLFYLFINEASAGQIDLYSPSRLAFVSSNGAAAIAVVDLKKAEQVDYIRIPIPAKILSSSTDNHYLAFSDKIAHDLYVLNLNSRKIQRFKMPSAVYRITFVPNSDHLFVELEKRIAMLDYKTGHLDVIDKEFQNLYTRFNSVFSVYSRRVWIMQEKTPSIFEYSFLNPEKGWREIKLKEKQGFGKGAPSFEDKLIAFNTYYADEGIIYFPKTGKTIRTGPLYNSRPLNEPLVEPYIDSNSHHVIFADKRGHMKIFSLDKSEQAMSFNVGFPPNQIKTGWLDQYLIVAGDQNLGIYPFSNLKKGTIFKFGYEENIADMWVSGNSKLLLFGTTRSNRLSRYDLQNQVRLPDIPLKGIIEISRIRMSSTNTVCY